MEVPEVEGNNARRNYKGVYQTKSGNWVSKIYDRNARVTVHLGTFYASEDAARAYDVAALKYQGDKARLNFPADPNVSCAKSAELLSSRSTRKRVSQSLPVSREEGQNHQSGLEQLQQEHQNVRNRMLLQEQTKGVEETEYGNVSLGNRTGGVELKSSGIWAYDEAALKIHGHRAMLNFPEPRVSYGHSVEHISTGENCTSKRRQVFQSSHSMLLQEQTKEMDESYVDSVYPGVGNIGQQDSSVKESEDALGFINSDGSIMSFLMAALEEEPVHQTLPDIVEAERNVADLTQTRIEYPSRDACR